MEARFVIAGEPRGKGRPRFEKKGRFVKTYTPDETVVYENLIRLEYERQCGGIFFAKELPLEMEVTAYYTIPKSASRKKAALMETGRLRPLKKVDSSNLLKVIEDALNTVAYHDDVQIVETRVSRFYGMTPRVEVTIRDICDGEDGTQ